MKEHTKTRDTAIAKYREVTSAPHDPKDAREAHLAVKAAQKAVSDAITDGAKPCPICGTPPHGMEQPAGKGRGEFEIGCLNCKPFVHTDGSIREPRVRGGLLPRHAVEAWNEGPDFWQRAADQSRKDLGPAPK